MSTSIAITPALSNTLRSASQYYIEITMKSNDGGATFNNTESVDISSILRESLQQNAGSQLFTFSVSDFFIKHRGDFSEIDREPLVLQCQQLTRGRSRFLTVFGSDVGIALAGANSAVVQQMPNRLDFSLGKLDLADNDDFTIYPPNGDLPAGTESQGLVSALIRFSLTINYLT